MTEYYKNISDDQLLSVALKELTEEGRFYVNEELRQRGLTQDDVSAYKIQLEEYDRKRELKNQSIINKKKNALKVRLIIAAIVGLVGMLAGLWQLYVIGDSGAGIGILIVCVPLPFLCWLWNKIEFSLVSKVVRARIV